MQIHLADCADGRRPFHYGADDEVGACVAIMPATVPGAVRLAQTRAAWRAVQG
jgi:hypothetical protein